MGISPLESILSTDLPGNWHEKRKGWGHAFHKLAPYVGGFPPRLANYFITRFSLPGDVVLDPFSGGGTAPLEACVLGRKGWGNDVFPYAHILTRAKVDWPEETQLRRYLLDLHQKVQNLESVPLDHEDVEIFYHPRTLEDLLKYRQILNEAPETRESNFSRAIMCAILHGPSKMFLSWPMKETCSSTVGYITRYFNDHKIAPRYRPIPERAEEKINRIYQEGTPPVRGRAFACDSRSIAAEGESVDFILTSPPYMRVLDYTWNNWLRLWFLGVDRREARDQLVLTASETRWRSFMRDSLREMYRLLRPGGWLVIVVGDVKKATKVINSAQILAEIGLDLGFQNHFIINDNYTTRNRTLLVYNDLKYSSFDRFKHKKKLAMPIDRCLLLSKGTPRFFPDCEIFRQVNKKNDG